MKDFIALDLKGLIAVNGGSNCSSSSSYGGGTSDSGGSGGSGDSGSTPSTTSYTSSTSSGGSGGGGCSGAGGSGGRGNTVQVNGVLPGPNAQCWQPESLKKNGIAGSIARSSAGGCSNAFQINRAKNGDTDFTVGGGGVGSGSGGCSYGTYQKLITRLAHNGDNIKYGEEKDDAPFMCDNLVEDTVEDVGLDPAECFVDDAKGKTCDDHIADLLASGKEYSHEAPTEKGVYAVLMNNGERTNEDGTKTAIPSHAVVLVVGDGGRGAYIVDNSSHNPNGGVDYTWSKNYTDSTSANDVLNQYAYPRNSMYIIPIHKPGF